ncbi:aminotransferase class IV [Mesonia sp. MT50]|uniref:branched-chain-amino-acid transaminase n=1 Tax=Mesonia profundi TaxID=3070998 RepID=A0ABU1A087_9FLAO|nr:aminotransferase class IV [Mesonia profundi]MDQ7917120.1 aminotransferase class IV [Mesonia profundi]
MINYNGKMVAQEDASLSIDNRGYHYGDSLFETLRVVHGKLMFWEDHYFRLMASMRILRMEIPMSFSPEFLEEEILSCVKENGFEEQSVRVKINIHRLPGGLYLPQQREIGYMISTSLLDTPFYINDESAYEVELYKDHYVASGLLSTLKTNNRIVNVLGSIYAEENDYENCLLLNEKKSVLEALNGNIFLVKGNSIKTPPLSDGCLNGIIRKNLIKIIGKLEDFDLKEESISPFELQKADELFVTNSIMGIQSITKYRKKSYDFATANNLRAKLNTQARLG